MQYTGNALILFNKNLKENRYYKRTFLAVYFLCALFGSAEQRGQMSFSLGGAGFPF